MSTLHEDEWVLVVADLKNFTVTWLNKSARLAIIRLAFQEEHKDRFPGRRLKTGRALVGPDGGEWLKFPELEVPRSYTSTVYAAALQLAVDHLRTVE